MRKIPVGKTIARAYRFAFRDFFKILGVMWLPIAVTWLPAPFLHVTPLQAPNAGNFAALREMWPILLPLYLVAMLFVFMQIIGIAQLALGTKKGPAWIYFSLDKPVWRLIGSVLFLIVAMIIGWLAVVLGGAVTGLLARLLTRAVNNSLFTVIIGTAAVVIMTVLWCGYIYALIRLTFLLVPVIAAEEEGFAPVRSWMLGLRNFWRMFAVVLAVVLPFLLLELVLTLGFLFRGITLPGPQASAAQKATADAAIHARMAELVTGIYHYWYVTYPLLIAAMVVFYGVGVSAPCFAWRALTEDEPSNPVTAD